VDIIKLLPDNVANQIAAGEVVQRPASAVKELLENAIDAGANDIKLIVKDAGRTLIQVIDNGKGMSNTDARLAWERHATSKIRTSDDLFCIQTMGFRGEALASIAAISQVEMKTRREEDDLGTQILIEGSEAKSQEQIHCAPGTSISMKNLFYNVPVRRNFLKSNAVEFRHILEEFYRVTLAFPELKFSLIHNDSELYHLKASARRQRIMALFGMDYNERLVPVEEETSITTVSGFVCKPEYARKTRGEQYFFVNNRFIKSSYLHHAVQSAYKDLLPNDCFPTYFIYLEIDPQKVDINIHPTKTEIKFEDEKSIYAILRSSVQRSLGRYNITPTLDFEQEASFNVPLSLDKPIVPPTIKVDPTFNPFLGKQDKHKPRQAALNLPGNNSWSWEKLYEGFEKKDSFQNNTSSSQDSISSPTEIPSSYFQVQNSYILCSMKGGIILIDQQGAHERILVEKFSSMLKNHTGVSQQLLYPLSLEYNAYESSILNEMLEPLHSLGIDIQPFGMNTFVVQGVAPYIQETNIRDLVDQFIQEFSQSSTLGDRNLPLARTLAQKTAIKKGQRLSQEEMESLVNDLFACENSSLNPAGKPTFFKIGLEEIERKFL
jgi:DNA mismatch repair protein MutL